MDPSFHSAFENPHVAKAGVPQDVRRTGGALLRSSDGDEKTRAPIREIAEAVRKIVERDVDGAVETSEGAAEFVGIPDVDDRRGIGF